jgi:hypothetical protein
MAVISHLAIVELSILQFQYKLGFSIYRIRMQRILFSLSETFEILGLIFDHLSFGCCRVAFSTWR